MEYATDVALQSLPVSDPHPVDSFETSHLRFLLPRWLISVFEPDVEILWPFGGSSEASRCRPLCGFPCYLSSCF